VIDEAIYGRRHIGKCISPDDIYSEIADNPQYLGCFANVLHLLDAKCSGRQSCQVRIPDVELERTKPCLKDLKLFLEVRHHCVEGKLFQLNKLFKQWWETSNLSEAHVMRDSSGHAVWAIVCSMQ